MIPTPWNLRRSGFFGVRMLAVFCLALLSLPGPAQQVGTPDEDLTDRFFDVQPPTIVKDAETLLRNSMAVVQPLDEEILAAAFSPDGKSLVTAGGWWRPDQIKISRAAPVSSAAVDSPTADALSGSSGSAQKTVLIVMFYLSLCVACLAVWHYFRSPDTQAHQPQQSGTNPQLSLSCPGCGKRLKARVELAGKKVKCPYCGKVVPIPQNPPASPTPASGRSWMIRGAILGGLMVAAGVVSLLYVVPLLYVGAPRISEPENYLDRPLGLERLAEVEEEGLWEPQFDRGWGEPFRWTNGSARLVIPLREQVPLALNVRLGLFVPRRVRLRIRVNGQPLFEEQVDMKLDWSRTFDLRQANLGRQVVIEVNSDTFNPPNDARVLGVGIRGVTLFSGTQVYNNVPLGVRPLPEVAEEGFHYQERQGGEPFRWTKGSARLVVPIRGKPPKILSLGLGIPNQKGYRIRVMVNGKKLFDDEVEPNQRWSADLPLDGVHLGDRAEIELTSSTFSPTRLAPGAKDQRILGVNVRRFVLVD